LASHQVQASQAEEGEVVGIEDWAAFDPLLAAVVVVVDQVVVGVVVAEVVVESCEIQLTHSHQTLQPHSFEPPLHLP